MSPVTHLLISWSVSKKFSLTAKEQLLLTGVGIAPDLDGAGIIAGLLYWNKEKGIELWGKYHHIFGHNLLCGLVLALGVWICSTRKKGVFLLALLTFHLHLLCDLLGSRGPDNYQWPIPYLWPFSETPQLSWSGQWQLNDWPNFVITIIFLILTFYVAWRGGGSPLGFFSARADAALIAGLRHRFGQPRE